jgi:hypothetical protein
MPTSVPTLSTNVNKWSTDMPSTSPNKGREVDRYWEPTVYVRQIAVRAAIDGAIGDIPSLAPNMTYSLVFPGPALHCDYANARQQNLFDYYRVNTSQTWELAPYDKHPQGPQWLVSAILAPLLSVDNPL